MSCCKEYITAMKRSLLLVRFIKQGVSNIGGVSCDGLLWYDCDNIIIVNT